MARKASSITIAEFLQKLPDDRRAQLERVRDVVRRHLPSGYEEAFSRGMLVYQVPLARYPDTYNGHPLWYVALASEKSYMSLHLMPVYASPTHAKRLADGFTAAGKKPNMGKACVRFKAADDLPLDTIGEIVGSIPVERWIEFARGARRRRR